MRVLLVETNAVSLVGHPAAGVRGLAEAAAVAGLETVIAVNVDATEELLAVIPQARPWIRETTFEARSIDDSFRDDLHRLATSINLGDDDIVVVLTAHAREVRGLARFAREWPEAPTCHAVIHQLYPPAPHYQETLDPAWRATSNAGLSDALRSIQGSPVRVWTTTSDRLRRSVTQLAGFEVAMLPLPMRSPSPSWLDARATGEHQTPRFVFVGDNRYEKGLLTILNMIVRREDGWQFTLHVTRPRGYGRRERELFESRMRMVRARPSVTLVERALSDDELAAIVTGATAILLPYDPNSYDRRISAVLLQALALGVPPIVTRGTWCAEYCSAMGVGVEYEHFDDLERAARSLREGIARMLAGRAEHERSARNVSTSVAKANSGQAALETLLHQPGCRP